MWVDEAVEHEKNITKSQNKTCKKCICNKCINQSVCELACTKCKTVFGYVAYCKSECICQQISLFGAKDEELQME